MFTRILHRVWRPALAVAWLAVPAVAAAQRDGTYQLVSINSDTLPVSTPSSFGTIRQGALTMRNGEYVIVYVYGADQRVRVDGTYQSHPEEGVVDFTPTTAGVAPTTAWVDEQGALVFDVPDAFGLSEAELVFALAAGNQSTPGTTRGGEVPVHHAHTLESYQSTPIEPDTSSSVPPARREAAKAGAAAPLLGTYQLLVEGAVYTNDDMAAGTRTTHASSGALGRRLVIRGDGTYSWGERRGRWRANDDAEWPLVLVNADQDRDWKVGPDTRRQGRPGDILVWDGYVWEVGRPIR